MQSDIPRVISLYQSGLTMSKVAKECGYRSHVSILRILVKAGIPTRSREEFMVGKSNARKHSLVQDLYSYGVNTEGKAYLLGLLYSDGWVSTSKPTSYTVGFGSTDLELVEIVTKILEASHPIRVKKSRKVSHKNMYEVRFDSKLLVSDLIALGCVERKSHVLAYPSNLGPDMTRHFIRGLWDGDGSVTHTRVKEGKPYLRLSLVGSKGITEGVCSVVEEKLGITGHVLEHGSVFRLSYGKGADVLYKYLYDKAAYFLSRKRSNGLPFGNSE